MKEYEGLINYLTNIILRPYRETYNVEKLGPPKFIVKSHEKSISMLESMSKNQKHLPKQLHQTYCQLIEVNRRQATIKRDGKSIQVSIYEPQLTCLQTKNTDNQKDFTQKANPNSNKLNFSQKKNCNELKYENCVVFLHANSGSRLEGTQYAKHVLQYRTLCVSFDYTGSGISQGHYTTMGVHESKDLSCVINFIAETYKVKKFSLWGRSMGAVTGIYYLLTKYKEESSKIRVTSCIIDSPFSHLEQLIKEIASRKSSLPQFVFQPILKIIESDIITKIGVNIFSQLNLIEKIKNLTSEERKLINSVSFLGLASKNDTMIDHQHCVDLCSLLIPEEVRRQDMVDQKNYLVASSFDKHFMMLVEFKREINTKGDFIQIEGNHNKPRSNQVKEKISFFIHDSFYSSNNDIQLTKSNQKVKNQGDNLLTLAKTGVSIKTKLSFSKAAKQPRKDSTMSSEMTSQQLNKQESLTRLNYNLINLKDIKSKQTKQSLSKDKQPLCNSLNKVLVQKERRDIRLTGAQSTKSIQSLKGLSIVSKELNKERKSQNNNNEDAPKASTKKAHEINQNSRTFSNKLSLQTGNSKGSLHLESNNSHSSGLVGKVKVEGDLPKKQNKFTKSSYDRSPNYSDDSESVNNSLKKSQQKGDVRGISDVVISPLELPDKMSTVNIHQNLTQREMIKLGKGKQSLTSDRVTRNNTTQTEVCENTQKQKIPAMGNTTQLNISLQLVDNCINNNKTISITPRDSMTANDPFKKKQSIQLLMQSTEISISLAKQTPKQPQVKLSIADFRNRQQQANKTLSATKRSQQPKRVIRKQNISIEANTPTTNWTQQKQEISMNTINMLPSTPTICLEGREGRQVGKESERVSIHRADMNRQDSFGYERRVQTITKQDVNVVEHKRQQSFSRNGINADTSNYYQQQQQKHQHHQKSPSVSSSISSETGSSKQMIIMNGQNGSIQSSTYNYTQLNYHHHQHHHQPPQQQNTSYQLYHQHDQRMHTNNNTYNNSTYPYQYINNTSFPSSFNQNQYYPHINNSSNNWERNNSLPIANGGGKSMHTSHEPNCEEFTRNKEYYCNYNVNNNRISMSAIQTNNAMIQQQQQLNITSIYHQQQFITNPNNPNIWYVPNEGIKQSIQYKKKINKLLD